MEVSLGARPLRGAVWATPYAKGVAELAPELAVTFSPERVVLYDDGTTANVTVSVILWRHVYISPSSPCLYNRYKS